MAAILAAILALVGVFEAYQRLLTPAGKAQLKNYLAQWFGSLVEVATPVLAAVEGELQPLVAAFVNAFNSTGPQIASTLRGPVADLVASEFAAAAGGLVSNGQSTPDNAVGIASNAMADAFGFGISSAAVTAAFEAAFPEKLNTLNGAGPMLAEMAGFAEVARAVRDPLYKNAFGRSLEYHYRSQFKPELPDETDAVLWHARGLLSDAQLKTIFDFSGLKSEYEEAYTLSAFRAVSPFIMARAMESGALTDKQMFDALTFYGMRPQDQDGLVAGMKELALKPYKDRALASAVIANQRGNLSDNELTSLMNDMNTPAPAQGWVHLAAAYRKLEQLAELYRKSVDVKYKFGEITDADYIPALEAIGIAAADAEAHYAIVSSEKLGRQLAAEERAAAAAARAVQHAAWRAAIADYEARNVDSAGLAGALAAANMPAALIPYVVAYQEARRLAQRRNVAGVLLDPDRAVGMRERIALVKEQVTKKLITPDEGFAQLEAAGIPTPNAQLIIGEAAAAAKIVWP